MSESSPTPEAVSAAASSPSPAAAPEPVTKQPDKMAGAAGMLSAATLVSRVLGVAREQVFAALLGAGFYGDSFTMAFRLPNLLRDLFAEGALSSAFQPAFIDQKKQGGIEAAYRLANLVICSLLLLVGGLVLAGLLWAPQLVASWAPGYAADKAALTTQLTRIMMPFLLLVSLAAVAMGMLNAQQRFVAPALAPALFNVVTVTVGGGLWLFGAGQSQLAAVGWAVATLLGGLLQLLVQVWPLWRSGYRFALLFDFRLADPALRRVLWTMAPATIGLMATQVNIYVSSSFASTESGAVTWLQVAFRLMQLPIGMFGVAVGTVALARAAQSASETDLTVAMQGVRETLRRGLLLVSFWTLPTAVVLWVLATPILRIIYQHGAFAATDTLQAAEALRLYAVGLLAYAAVKVVAPVFYALKLPRVPVLATILAVLGSVLWCVLLHPVYQFRALALGTSLGAVINLAVLLISFSRRYGGLFTPTVVLSLARMAAASACAGLAMWAMVGVWLGKNATELGITATSIWGCILLLGVTLAIGGGTYVTLCLLMGVSEVREVGEVLQRRLRRRKAP